MRTMEELRVELDAAEDMLASAHSRLERAKSDEEVTTRLRIVEKLVLKAAGLRQEIRGRSAWTDAPIDARACRGPR